jgi:hypothetical protein
MVTGALRPEQLSTLIAADTGCTRRALRALATIGFCKETGDGAFELEDLGAFLSVSQTSSLRDWLTWFTRHQWGLWPKLSESIRSGTSARSALTGVDGFLYLQKNSEPARVFNGAMSELTAIVGRHLLDHVDFSRYFEIVDIGGGNGELLTSILVAHLEARGIVYDLPHAEDGAIAKIAALNLSNRCEFQRGDFFERVPGDAGLYLLKSVLHDWDDARAERILTTCRAAMGDGSVVLIVERVMPSRMSHSVDDRALAWTDLMMMIGPGGRERELDEFIALIERSGLRCSSHTNLGFGHFAIEAVPA